MSTAADRRFTAADRARLAGFHARATTHDCARAEIQIDAAIAGGVLLADERDQAREERDEARAAAATLRAAVARLSAHNADLRVALARRAAPWWATAYARLTGVWAGLDGLHRQTLALAAFCAACAVIGIAIIGGV